MWHELDFIASANIRTYIQFYFNEAAKRASGQGDEAPQARVAPEDNEITSEATIKRAQANYLARAAGSNEVAIKAIEDHFKLVNDSSAGSRKRGSKPSRVHLEALLEFRRAGVSPAADRSEERDDLLRYYQSLREKDGLDHEEAMRDCVVQRADVAGFLLSHRSGRDRARACSRFRITRWPAG